MRLSKLFAAGVAVLLSSSFISATNAGDTLKVAHYDQPAQMGMPYFISLNCFIQENNVPPISSG